MNNQKIIKKNLWFSPLLICPNCGYEAMASDLDLNCKCGVSFNTRIDYRITKDIYLSASLSRRQQHEPSQLLQEIDTTHPNLSYAGPSAVRDSKELMSEVSLRLPNGGCALDLGCGPRDQAVPLEFLGFKYVGVDYSNQAADILADAHLIPFKDSSFDCIFSYAVIEHLHNPFIALSEVYRVLKPGGFFIGTVSQGEPFHSSYFHHTPWALVSIVNAVPGLKIMRLWESVDTLRSLSAMGRYSRIIKTAIGLVDWLAHNLTWLAPRKMLWSVKEKQLDRLYRAGSICFSIQKAPFDKDLN